MEWMSYAYENVRIRFVSPFDLAPDSWNTRKNYIFSVEPEPDIAELKPKGTEPSDKDFDSIQSLNTEIVTITWTGRPRCKAVKRYTVLIVSLTNDHGLCYPESPSRL